MRVHLILTLDRALVAKAADGEQPGLFGDLIPTQKVVRRKTGKTHTQTFHTRPESHLSVPKPRPQSLEEAARAGRSLERPRTGEEADMWREQARQNAERPVTRAEFESLTPRAAAPAKRPTVEAARRKVARAHEAFERAMQQAYGRAPVPHDFHRDPATYDNERVQDAARAYKAATDGMVAAMDAEAATPGAKPSIESVTGTRPDGSPWMQPSPDRTLRAPVKSHLGRDFVADVPMSHYGEVDEKKLRDYLVGRGIISDDVRAIFLDPWPDSREYAILDVDTEDSVGSITLPEGVRAQNEPVEVPNLYGFSAEREGGHHMGRVLSFTAMASKDSPKVRFTMHSGDPYSATDEQQVQDAKGRVIGRVWWAGGKVNAQLTGSRGIHESEDTDGALHDLASEYLNQPEDMRKAAGLEGMAQALFAKAIRPNLTAKKITRKDNVTQTYHTGQKKTPSVRTPGAAQPATAGRHPAQPKPASVPTRVTGAPKQATRPQAAPAQAGGPQVPKPAGGPQVRPALQQATATGPRPGQRADGLPPKATGASVERAASRASRPKSITSEDIPSPPSYDPDLDAFKAVFEHEGEEGLLKAATTHITRMLRAHRAYLDTVRDRFDAHVIEGHAVINMGLPASGKTSAAKRHALRHGQYLHVDVDALKHMHPEYDPKAPEKVHGFSKKLEAVFWEQAKAQRLPMVLDTTGGNWPKWTERIKALRDAGYHQIGLAYAKVDVDEARRRNLARDRTVPEEVIEGTLAEFDPNHPQNQGKTPFEHMRPHVDRVHVYDHRYEADRHGFTEFGKHHSSAARASAWADYTASERRARAAAGMGKAASLTLAGLFGRLAGYHEDGGTA